MTLYPFKIPQLGEGLVGARIVALLKGVGERVARDEPLLEIETDKAVMSLESPVAGVVDQWLVQVEDDAAIGAVVCQLQVAADSTLLTEKSTGEGASQATTEPETFSGGQPMTSASIDSSSVVDAPLQSVTGPQPAAISPLVVLSTKELLRNNEVSPRLRALARENGVTAQVLRQLAQQGVIHRLNDAPTVAPSRNSSLNGELKLSVQTHLTGQRGWASYRIATSSFEREVGWDAIQGRVQSAVKEGIRVTPLHIIAHAVAQVMVKHSPLRIRHVAEGITKRDEDVHLGFAVTIGDSETEVAVVPNAQAMDVAELKRATRSAIAAVISGEGTAEEPQLTLWDFSRSGLVSATLPLLSTSVANLVIGTPFDAPMRKGKNGVQWEKRVRVVLSCDSCVIGSGTASRFLAELAHGLKAPT